MTLFSSKIVRFIHPLTKQVQAGVIVKRDVLYLNGLRPVWKLKLLADFDKHVHVGREHIVCEDTRGCEHLHDTCDMCICRLDGLK
jgi:hypothetical protein